MKLPYKLNETEKEFARKNDVWVKFQYESATMLFVDEKQEFTGNNLFIYFGGMLGLFVGMSVISPAEVLNEIIIKTVELVTKFVTPSMGKKSKKVVWVANEQNGKWPRIMNWFQSKKNYGKGKTKVKIIKQKGS